MKDFDVLTSSREWIFFLLKKHLVHFCRQFLSRQITVLNWIHNEKVMLDMNATSRSMAYLCCGQKYNRLRCLLRVKVLAICFYCWSGSILQFRLNIIKAGWKSWLLTYSSDITLSLPSYTGSALKREPNFCDGYLSLLYFWLWLHYVLLFTFFRFFIDLSLFLPSLSIKTYYQIFSSFC